jgi:H+/Cl- antiporter ClcA
MASIRLNFVDFFFESFVFPWVLFGSGIGCISFMFRAHFLLFGTFRKKKKKNLFKFNSNIKKIFKAIFLFFTTFPLLSFSLLFIGKTVSDLFNGNKNKKNKK